MKLISYLGIVVAVIPFLGIPNSWKTVFFVVVGLTIFSQAYLLKLRSRKKDSNIVFTQNNPEQIRSEFNYGEEEKIDSTDIGNDKKNFE